MKRKRDLPDEDQNLRSKKKQKCQHFKLDLIKDGEPMKDPNTEEEIMTYVEYPQKLKHGWSVEIDEEKPTFKDGAAQYNKPTTPSQLRLFGEEGNPTVGSHGPTGTPGTSAPPLCLLLYPLP